MTEFIIEDLGEPHDREVYHYTKLENLFRIITEKGLVFHASRFDVMNDPEDSTFISNEINRKIWESGLGEEVGEFHSEEASPFVVSFSCSKDNKIMWRLYDADVMLHIDTDVIYQYCKSKSCKHIYMGKVKYSENVIKGSEEDTKLLQDVWNEQMRFDTSVLLALYKHPDFEIENEWRLMSFGNDKICSEIKSKGVKYNTLWLYREIYLPKECLKGITLRVYDVRAFDALHFQIELMLKDFEYPIGFDDIYQTNTAEVRK